MISFEELYSKAQSLQVPTSSGQRWLDWCESDGAVALAKLHGGGIEIFIAGPEIHARLPLVRRHLKHDRWSRVEGGEIEANRLVLPADEHFVAVAAFLVEELLRSGVSVDGPTAFAECEPLIEMALRRTALDDETVVGLIGELYFLSLLLSASTSSEAKANCIEAWRGYERSARDFIFEGQCAIEVKVTRSRRSTHEVNNLSQVDPRRAADGSPVEQLYLVSIGLTPPEDDELNERVTLQSLVETILLQLGTSSKPQERNEIQELLLARIARYGAASRRGYSHDEMGSWPAYMAPWRIRHERAYDMNDPQVQVVRRADVEGCEFVDPESIRCVIDLPDEIVAGQNPLPDLAGLAASLAS